MKKILIVISCFMILLAGCGTGRDAEYDLEDSYGEYSASESDSQAEASDGSTATESISEESTVQESNAEGTSEDTAAQESASEETAQTADTSEPKTLFVYVCGAVKDPGVYELPWGSRIYQAVEAAGGLLKSADDRCLNQAELLTDGQQIIVYEEGEEIPENTSSGSSSDQQASSDSGSESLTKVNINTADREKLMTLPGIGESRADEIINYRTEHGNFTAIEDIMNISGIKDKMFAKIRDYIEV